MMSDKRFQFVVGLMNVSLGNIRGQVTSREQNDKLMDLCNEIFQNIQNSREPEPKAIPEPVLEPIQTE